MIEKINDSIKGWDSALNTCRGSFRLITWIELVVALAMASCGIVLFGIKVGAIVTLSFCLAYAVPRYWYVTRKHATAFGQLVLVMLWVFLLMIAIHDIDYGLSGVGTLREPMLTADAWGYHRKALRIYEDWNYLFQNERMHWGLPLFLVGVWKIFGASLIYTLASLMMLSMCTMVLSSCMVVRALRGRIQQSVRWIGTAAMGCALLLLYLHSQEIRIQKECLCAFSMTLCGYALAGWLEKERASKYAGLKDVLIFGLGLVIMGFTRPSVMIAFAIGPVLLTIFARGRGWGRCLAMMGVFSSLYVLIVLQVSAFFGDYVDDGGDKLILPIQFFWFPNHMALGALIGDYFTFAWWQKALLLPVTATVQYLTPFMWGLEGYDFGEMVCRQTWGWYCVGGLAVFYVLFLSYRRQWQLGGWTLWALMCYAMPAYVVAGTLARYSLIFQPLVIPMTVMAISVAMHAEWRKLFNYYVLVYVVCLVLALGACFARQWTYLHRLGYV